MNAGYTAYRLLTTCGAAVLVPLIWLHHRFRGEDFSRFYQRMGCYPDSVTQALAGRPRIWIHAASVGEMRVASVIARTLMDRYPGCVLALSSVREQGFVLGRAQLGDHAACFFAPLDLIRPTRKALATIQPDILVLLETEIWPNLIVNAHRMGARIAIVNGRISSRSIGRYQKVRSLMQYTLSHVDAFSMIGSDDARRIQSLGAPAGRIRVNGNAKFDSPDPLQTGDIPQWAARLYGIASHMPVLVAGSTRNPEERAVLDAFVKIRAQFPDAVLIIAPRHIERADQVRRWVEASGLACQYRTAIDGVEKTRVAPVVILNTIGELAATYSVADVVFCGGSLAPKGGQNIMEPAMWGKPILFGPSMEDFADACDAIRKSGGGIRVNNAEAFAAQAMQWLAKPAAAKAAGLAARQALLPHRGAAQKHAEVILRLLKGRP